MKDHCVFRERLYQYIEKVKERMFDNEDIKEVLSKAFTDECWKFRRPISEILVNMHTLLTADPISVMGLLGYIDYSAIGVRILQQEAKQFIMGEIPEVSCLEEYKDMCLVSL